MYYKRKRSKLNWPIILIVLVIIAFITIVVGFIIYTIKNKDRGERVELDSRIIPTIVLTKSTEAPEQKSVDIEVIAETTDEQGIAKIVVKGKTEEVIDPPAKQYKYKFTATKNEEYEIQAIGGNGTFISDTISINNIKEISAVKPYIPKGFTVIENEKEPLKGMVVKDKYGNEFVWVPILNGKIIRSRTDTDDKYIEDTLEHSQFINSISNYQGFYISRYEASYALIDGQRTLGSKPNETPIFGISYKNGQQYALNVAKMYGYTDMISSLISSTGWDTTLAWLETLAPGYSTSLAYGNYSSKVHNAGENKKDKVGNIFDLAGNVKEWTTERYILKEVDTRTNEEAPKDDEVRRIIRGGAAGAEDTPNRSLAELETKNDKKTGLRYILFIK